jgi:hypothetical protein
LGHLSNLGGDHRQTVLETPFYPTSQTPTPTGLAWPKSPCFG